MVNAFIFNDDATSWGRLVETAYDKLVEYALYEVPQFRQVVDKRPGSLAMNSDTAVLTLHQDLAVSTTPLVETVDPDAVGALQPLRVTVTAAEYGLSTIMTNYLLRTAFTNPDQERAKLLARNMVDTHDEILRALFNTGTNFLRKIAGAYSKTGARTAITASDKIDAGAIATARTLLRRAKVMPKAAEAFLAYAHPDITVDVMRDAGANSWSDPHKYQDTAAIYSGEVGKYAGVRFVETTRCTPFVNGGATNTDVYPTYIFGQQAIVELTIEEPRVVVGPQVDKLRRHWPLGWRSFLGWNHYRPEALLRLETSSSIEPVLA